MSSRFPGSRVKALSNSNQQREYIEEQARERGIANLKVFTGDVAKVVKQTKTIHKQTKKEANKQMQQTNKWEIPREEYHKPKKKCCQFSAM